MLFNTFEFLWLFPLIFGFYYVVPRGKFPKYFLLLVSYGLYLKWKPVYALILLWVTVVTYWSALQIAKNQAFGKRKYLVWSGIVLASLPLIVFKYKFI